MMRALALATMATLVALILWLPSTAPASHFLLLIEAERQSLAAAWSHESADVARERSLRMVAAFSATQSTAAAAPASPVSDSVLHVRAQLLDNPYMQSMQALLALALWRAAVLLLWLPMLLAFGLALGVDAQTSRWLRAREFGHHDPELYALFGTLTAMGFAVLLLSLLSPWSQHAFAAPVAIAIGLVLLSLTAASFHRRA